VAWLLKIETDSILIKEMRKHLSKTLDRVSKLMELKRLKFGLRESSHRSVYRYTKFIRYRIVLLIMFLYSCIQKSFKLGGGSEIEIKIGPFRVENASCPHFVHYRSCKMTETGVRFC
jgi:hypothetical protein